MVLAVACDRLLLLVALLLLITVYCCELVPDWRLVLIAACLVRVLWIVLVVVA